MAPDNDLNLDLESVVVDGQRYAIDADQHIESQRRDGVGANERTAEHVGGGAILGSIIGASPVEGKAPRLAPPPVQRPEQARKSPRAGVR